jgi:hypothetical protein
MTCVMLGGSRRISKLPADVRLRLDRLVERKLMVVVGDANGADKAFQQHFASISYPAVEVFCAGSVPRNNQGRWPCRQVSTTAKPGTFDFYAAKDKLMAEEATVGFMLWDGESAGTVLNVWRLLQRQKTSLVWLQASHQFLEVRSDDGWRQLVGQANDAARADIDKRIRGEAKVRAATAPTLFGSDLDSAGLT